MAGQAARTAVRGDRNRRLLVGLFWGAILLAGISLLTTGEGARIVQALAGARLSLIGPLLLIGIMLPIIHARRWQLMLRAISQELPLTAAVELTVTSSLINYAVPGYVGSPAKGLLARQTYGIGLGRSVPTLAVEQALDALALVIGATVGLILAGPSSLSWLAASFDRSLVTMIVMLLGIGLTTLLLAGYLLRRRARQFIEALIASSRMLANNRQHRTAILLLTGARWVADSATIWVAAAALGVHLGATALLLLTNIPLLLGLVSPFPGGVGLREGVMAAIAGMINLTITGIVAAAVLHRAVMVAALPVLLGIIRVARWSASWR